MSTEIVILGGGYTAVWAARRLLEGLRRRPLRRGVDARVTVVSASRTHAFHGWTAEVITGQVRIERTLTPLVALLPGVRVVPGVVTGIDLDRRRVNVAGAQGAQRLAYDHLVIGVGSQDAAERVPGLHEHGFTTKGDGELARLVAHLDDVVARAAATDDRADRSRLLTVIVAGGGFAGVETSVAIRQRLVDAVARVPALAGARPRVVVVHAGDRLLPSLRPRFERVAEHAAAQVRAAGVEVRCGTRLTSVSAESASLASSASVDAVRTGTVVTTIGQRPISLPGTEALDRDVDGRIAVDRWLRVRRNGDVVDGVWAGGDVAAVPHPVGTGPCPASALWAIYHGARIGANVTRSIQGRPPRPFRFPGLGQAASFGVGRASAELAGVPLLGWPGWVARWTLFHYYMPSRYVALCTLLEWLRPPVDRRTGATAEPEPEADAVAA